MLLHDYSIFTSILFFDTHTMFTKAVHMLFISFPTIGHCRTKDEEHGNTELIRRAVFPQKLYDIPDHSCLTKVG
jgi:hypothetical protein